MEELVTLLIGCFIGIICAMIATSRGRSGVAWFFIGLFFQCFGLIVLLVLPDLKVQEEKERRLRSENRRLREQLKKDRAVADARHHQAEQRLTAHDRALGLDTAPEVAPPDSAPAVRLASGLQGAQWYYLDADRERQGPVPLDGLRLLWRQAVVGAHTLVWTRAFEDWIALGEVPGLEDELRA